MNHRFLVIFGLLTILDLNNAWNNAKGQGQQQVPFWKSGSVKSTRTKSYQQTSGSYQQDEASAEPAQVIPTTSFDCAGKPYQPGMYADEETDCRVYHVCFEDRKESQFCGDGTVFNQKILTCDYPKDTDCANSQRYWSANEELGKPGAEPAPGGQRPQQQFVSQPSPAQKTRQSSYRQTTTRTQSKSGFSQQSQQPQQTYNSYQAEDSGFVNEPVKKLRPTYKVVKTTQQSTSYPANRQVTIPNRVRVSPAKSKVVQHPIPLDVQGPVSQNYQPTNYGQSDSYFSQQQTSGTGWQPSAPISQPASTQQQQQYYSSQQSTVIRAPQKTTRNRPQQQQQYSQQSDSQGGWTASNRPGGGYSYNDVNEKKIDLSIPQTNFECEGKPYEPGMYADMETQCTVYHVCFDGRKEDFICGGGTAFNQKLLTCDYIGKFKCEDTPRYYSVNENLVNDQGSWVLRQSSNQQQGYSSDGWSNQRKIK